MCKSNKLLLSLLVFAASLLSSNQASAKVCVAHSSSGSCLYWTGSVEADLNADHVNVKKNPELGVIITPNPTTGGAGTGNPSAVLLCGTPPAPTTGGTATTPTQPTTSADSDGDCLTDEGESNEGESCNPAIPLPTTDPVASVFSKSVPLTNANKQGTVFYATVNANALDFSNNTGALQPYCSTGQVPLDYVSCNFTAVVQEKQKGKVKASATFNCSLPAADCANLLPNATDPTKFSRIPYTCTRVSPEKDIDDETDND